MHHIYQFNNMICTLVNQFKCITTVMQVCQYSYFTVELSHYVFHANAQGRLYYCIYIRILMQKFYGLGFCNHRRLVRLLYMFGSGLQHQAQMLPEIPHARFICNFLMQLTSSSLPRYKVLRRLDDLDDLLQVSYSDCSVMLLCFIYFINQFEQYGFQNCLLMGYF